MNKVIYIFRGSPAGGKTTLVPIFCTFLEQPVAVIAQDNMRWNFHRSGRNSDDVEEWEHAFASRNLEVLLEEYLKLGRYSIVVEGLFTYEDDESSLGSVARIKRVALSHGFSTVCILLTASENILRQRNSMRKHVVPVQEFDFLYSSIDSIRGADEIVIDTSEQTIDESVSALRSILATKDSVTRG
jgi:predicted kinase